MKQFLDYGIPLKEFNLTRDDSGPQRFYIGEDGYKYLSVTSFLGQFGDKEALQKWRDAVGEEEASRISKVATDKGTAIHLACENLLLNKPSPDSHLTMFDKFDFKNLRKHIEENVDKVFALEHQMFSKKISLAGTTDCIAEYHNSLSIIDFKTSSRLKYRDEISSYFLQGAAYAVMFYEQYKIIPKQIVILMLVDKDPNVSVFIEPVNPWISELMKLVKQQKEVHA